MWPEHARVGSWGWEIVDELAPPARRRRVAQTSLRRVLRNAARPLLRFWGVDTLVIAAPSRTSRCTTRPRAPRCAGIEVVIPRDAISALDPFDLESSLRQTAFLFAGQITTAQSLIVGPRNEVSRPRGNGGLFR